MADTTDAWTAFLNPGVVRPKLIAAGLFLLGYEMLIDSIKRRPLEFFSNRWAIDRPVPSDKYRAEVLALDPKWKSDAQPGSVAWLRKVNAVTANDETTIRTLTTRETRSHTR
ncbi:MAG: hypothetical protein H0T60_19055 [Acidobacteria bacterium]|nr:hypothetical protein [Acidobacteriota bacterium]